MQVVRNVFPARPDFDWISRAGVLRQVIDLMDKSGSVPADARDVDAIC
jgi:hypothetical protein